MVRATTALSTPPAASQKLSSSATTRRLAPVSLTASGTRSAASLIVGLDGWVARDRRSSTGDTASSRRGCWVSAPFPLSSLDVSGMDLLRLGLRVESDGESCALLSGRRLNDDGESLTSRSGIPRPGPAEASRYGWRPESAPAIALAPTLSSKLTLTSSPVLRR